MVDKQMKKPRPVKDFNLFRSLGAQIANIYELEEESYNVKLSDGCQFTFPKLAPGRYRTHVLHTLPTAPESVVTRFITVIDAPALAKAEFNTPVGAFLVGYDIEYQAFDAVWNSDTCTMVAPPTKLLSHQFWFNFQGVRFGVVFLTESRFSQRQFVDVLDAVVPMVVSELPMNTLSQPSIKIPKRTVNVWSYFSVVESGWMRLGNPQEKIVKRKFSSELVKRFYDADDIESKKSAPWIRERDLEWYGYCPIHEGTANLFFADAINLRRGGLAGLGKEIGIPKLDHEHIERMEWYRENCPIEYTDYGIVDSIIAAEAQLYYSAMTKRLTGIDVQKTRITGFSAEVFKSIFIKHFGPDWKLALGYEKVGKKTVPTLIHKAFVKHYHGGRNDVLRVGPCEDAHYLDLHSAYLTSVVMLNDYNFSKSILWNSEEAEIRVEQLMELGPFLPFGVTCSFRFKKTTVEADGNVRPVYPIFPVRIDDPDVMPGSDKHFVTDGLLFPRTGCSSFTWAEFWVAKRLNLLDNYLIHELVEFAPVMEGGVPSHHLSDEVLAMLQQRATGSEDVKAYMKAILNFFYGKLSQSVATAALIIKSHDAEKRIDASVLSCYPLASYITGFCRATVGSLLQLNKCHGITTDGFITPVALDKLVIGEFCEMVEKKVVIYEDIEKTNRKRFINTEASGDKSLFTKTRGYMILDGDEPKKIAAQGAQVRINGKYTEESVVKFAKQLQEGHGDKGYWPKLSLVREIQKKNNNFVPDRMIRPNTKIDMTFDMKQLPLNPVLKDFEYKGEKYPFMSFNTQPLESMLDFHILRLLSKRRDPLRRYRDNLEFWCKYFNDHFANLDSEHRMRKFTKVEDFALIVELQKECKVHVPYMELADYTELLEEFEKYRNGHMYEPENLVLPGFKGELEDESI